MHVERSGIAVGGLRREAQKLAPRAAERRLPERADARDRAADTRLRQTRRQFAEPGERIGRRQRDVRAGMLVEPVQNLVRCKPRRRVPARRQREAHVPLRLDGIIEIGIKQIMLQARELRRTIRRALRLPDDLQDMGLGAIEKPQLQLGEPHVEHDRAHAVEDARIRQDLARLGWLDQPALREQVAIAQHRPGRRALSLAYRGGVRARGRREPLARRPRQQPRIPRRARKRERLPANLGFCGGVLQRPAHQNRPLQRSHQRTPVAEQLPQIGDPTVERHGSDAEPRARIGEQMLDPHLLVIRTHDNHRPLPARPCIAHQPQKLRLHSPRRSICHPVQRHRWDYTRGNPTALTPRSRLFWDDRLSAAR